MKGQLLIAGFVALLLLAFAGLFALCLVELIL
jgi:hypothetical protein